MGKSKSFSEHTFAVDWVHPLQKVPKQHGHFMLDALPFVHGFNVAEDGPVVKLDSMHWFSLVSSCPW